MKYYSVSIDFGKTKPIALKRLQAMAYNPATPREFANYIRFVLGSAERVTNQIGTSLSTIKFRIHKTGCILPFGEGDVHPYAKNFYTQILLPEIHN